MPQQPLFANAGYLWGVTLVQSVGGVLFFGLAARLYTNEEVGIASAVLSIVMLLADIATFGVGAGLIRFLPKARHPHRFLNTAFTFNAVLALLVASLYLAGIPLWSPSLSALRTSIVYFACFLAFTISATLVAMTTAAFVARRRAGYALVQTSIISGGRLLLVAPLVGLGAVGLVGSLAVAVLLALAVSFALLLPRVEPGYWPRPSVHWPHLATILPFSAGNYLARLLTQAPQFLLPLLILEMLGPAASGYAYVAWMLGGVLAGPGLALASSAFAEGSNAPGSLSVVLSRSVRAGMVLTIAGALVVVVGAPWLLGIFGAEYAAEAATLLRWLAVAAPLVVLTSLYFTRLRVEKRIGTLVLLSGMIAFLTLGLAAALMLRYDIAAAGVGWLLGNGLVAALAAGRMWLDRVRPR
jgi:O-antigen/teichoic acid export membrane protein